MLLPRIAVLMPLKWERFLRCSVKRTLASSWIVIIDATQPSSCKYCTIIRTTSCKPVPRPKFKNPVYKQTLFLLITAQNPSSGEKNKKHSLHLADTTLSCKSHLANQRSKTQLVHNQNLVLLITAQNPSSGKTDSLHSFPLADST